MNQKKIIIWSLILGSFLYLVSYQVTVVLSRTCKFKNYNPDYLIDCIPRLDYQGWPFSVSPPFIGKYYEWSGYLLAIGSNLLFWSFIVWLVLMGMKRLKKKPKVVNRTLTKILKFDKIEI